MATLETGAFVLEAKCAFVAGTGPAVFAALSAVGGCFVALLVVYPSWLVYVGWDEAGVE